MKKVKWGTLLLAGVLAVSGVFGLSGERRADAAAGIKASVRKVSVSGRTFTVQTVAVPKGTKAALGLAQGRVGQTQDFKTIVKNSRATAAINGAFFNSYGGPADPYGTLISKGQIVHTGYYGTSIGFKKDGTVLMDRLMARISGTVTGKAGKSGKAAALGWYATFVNRTPDAGQNVVLLYNSARGSNVGFSGGTAVTVRKGKVVKKAANANATIPSDGYVLVYHGSEQAASSRFEVGSTVEMKIAYENAAGKPIPWDDVATSVGAGPRLVKDGKVSLDAAGEGFNDPKILSASGARSGIAIMADGSVVLATVGGATMSQWAQVMQKLGARQAMNLDGGASSALYANGSVLTSAGRALSNTLVFGDGVSMQ
ncbi:phosphodiester glycosidase family protein [Saccharibacillus sp. CPCC 101409]|uniref:phosphodiester glycosidase family protein n=1 Tax=Saccharibacillus sp. CPCC 101409 TaxID=3058041 RepID=UPI002673968E|nr:phosphodiester glycosidase family protein [Saccharibacillus sp. CPCC 101409]MDO3408775.1 phosphodiester glycosidase family protein [Saccharibacillus sp. CPCC 101409]